MRFLKLVPVGLAALLAAPLVASAPAAAQTVHTPAASIARDCSRDVTPELNAFFVRIPHNALVRLPYRACYRIDREVVIKDKSGLRLEGNHAAFRRFSLSPQELRYPHANAHLRFVGLVNSLIEKLHVVGTNKTSDLAYLRPHYGAYDRQFEFEHAYSFHGARNVTLRHSFADAVWGDGVNITGADQYHGLMSDRVRVQHVTIDRNGRQGVTVIATNVLLDGLVIKHSRRSGIDLEPNTGDSVVSGIEIRNTRINSWLLAFASAGRGAVNDVWLHHNRIERSGVPFVYVKASDGTRRTNWRVTDNLVTADLGSPLAAIRFYNVGGGLIARNDVNISPNQSQLAVEVKNGTSGLLIECNLFRNAKPAFVDSDGSSSYRLRNNAIGSTRPTC